MKKKIIGGMLAVVLAAGLIQTSVSKVAAEPDEAAMTETEEAVTDEDSEAADEDLLKEEETEQEIPEENAKEADESVEETEETAEEDKEEVEIQGMKITLENTLQETIVSVQVKSFFADTYSENLLAEDAVLETGCSQMMGIPEAFQDAELGMYDVRITGESGTITDIPLVPFLEDVSGTLYEEDGLTMIRIRDARLEAEAEPVSEAEMVQQETEASQIMAEALAEEVE